MATLFITTDGAIEGIYSDDLSGLLTQGDATITRASHVEPSRDADGNLRWFADMSPSGGPILGPFTLRSEALTAEVAWIHKVIYGEHNA